MASPYHGTRPYGRLYDIKKKKKKNKSFMFLLRIRQISPLPHIDKVVAR